MIALFAATARSLAFLSRLPPVPGAFEGEHRLGDDAHAFPVAGLLAALPSAILVLVAGHLGLSAPTIAIAAIGLLVAVTGGLHEDGLADVADGLGGHRPREKVLAIMKDSRIGAYGALALILSIGLRAALLAELVAHDAAAAALSVMIIAAASRGAMGWLWSSLPSADPGGLADSVGQPSGRQGRLSAGIGAAILVLPAFVAMGPLAAVLPLALGVLVLGQFRRMLIRRLGGQTGDCLGASQQIVEMAMLLGLAVAVGLN